MAKSKNTRAPGRPPKYPKSEDDDRSMKRFQVSLPPELFAALEAFRTAQRFKPERSAIIEKLIERFLIEENCYRPPPEKP